MTTRQLLIYVSTLLIAGSYSLTAQDVYTPTEVNISKDKVRSGGNIYYAHSVLERQTLFGISKAYGVTVEEIYAANPGLEKNGLQTGSVILIPTESAQKPEEVAEETTEMVSATQVLEQQETRKGTRKSKATQEDRITDEYILHTVKWYEDIDDIALKYEVPVDVIMEYNNLKSPKLKSKMKLKIPLEAVEEAKTAAREREKAQEEKRQAEEQALMEEENAKVKWEVFGRKDKVRVAVVLPFNAKGSNPDAGCLDFYSGLLLAVKDVSEAGTGVELVVYDCGDGSMIGEDRLDDVDLVIGPMSVEDLEKLLGRVPDGICVISPLNQKAAGLDSLCVNFVQAPTAVDVQYQDVIDWVSHETGPYDNVVVISEKSSRTLQSSQTFARLIDESGMRYKSFSYSLLEGRNIYDSMAAVMSPEGCNRVIINSENEAFVNDVVRNLGVIAFNKYDVVVYGPSKLHSFSSPDTESLHNLGLHVSLSYYVDYDSPAVKDFLLAYRALYSSEPSQYSFQGYDVAKYFITLTARHGNRWLMKMSDHRDVDGNMLQTDFVLNKLPNGGWHNEGIRRIVYGEDFEIKME